MQGLTASNLEGEDVWDLQGQGKNLASDLQLPPRRTGGGVGRAGGEGGRGRGGLSSSLASFHVHDSSLPSSALRKDEQTRLDTPGFEPGHPLHQASPKLGGSASHPQKRPPSHPRLWVLACSWLVSSPPQGEAGCCVGQRRPIPGVPHALTLGQSWKLGPSGALHAMKGPNH